MPRLTPYPVPKKRYHGGRWRIYWKWDRKQYSITTDHFDEGKVALVDSDYRRISAALAEDEPSFPEKFQRDPAVIQYIQARYPSEAKPEIPASETLLKTYDSQMTVECGKEWARSSRVRLAELAALPGSILNVTPELARQYLTDIVSAGRSPATRNRALNVFNRFFNEMKRIGYVTHNPFTGNKLLKEPREEVIVYCTRKERARIINMARTSGMPDWIGVPIAFFTGMHMSEITRMRWDDVNWDQGRIIIPKTKKSKLRTVDLSSKLQSMLALTPKEERNGFVVPNVEGVSSRRDRAQTLIRELRKIAAKENDPVPGERIGWNPWRHTFATLLVQEGETLDTVCALTGNTPEVCRRHYAQFIPRDKRIA